MKKLRNGLMKTVRFFSIAVFCSTFLLNYVISPILIFIALLFIETSAKTGEAVEEGFLKTAELIYKNMCEEYEFVYLFFRPIFSF